MAADHPGPAARARKEQRDFFAEIRRADVFVHQPYESFADERRALRAGAAASDPDVIAHEDDRVPDERRSRRSWRR